MRLIVVVIFVGVVTAVVLPRLVELLKDREIVRKNYRGESVPIAVGIGIVMGGAAGIGLLLIGDEKLASLGILYLAGVLGMAVFGLFDDFVGDAKVKGLKGHLHAMLHGKLTSGGIKATSGTAIALFLSAAGNKVDLSAELRQLIQWVVGAMVIALMTNFLNLADLRPGRAGKLFLALSLVTLAVIPWCYGIWLLPMMTAALVYLPWDLGEKAMMGDIGANVLGVSVGTLLAWGVPFRWQVAILFALLAVHLLAERVSFSAIIDEVPLLRSIDSWGRRHK